MVSIMDRFDDWDDEAIEIVLPPEPESEEGEEEE